jgi:1,4-dihydroxy-2-naphthoyl-CoA hydrolase
MADGPVAEARPDPGPADPGPAELAEAARTAELPSRLGIEITDWNPQRMVGTMPVEGNRQPFGLLHGGASCALAETLGSLAAVRNAPDGRSPVGVEISASHHRAVRTGLVTGVCTPLYTGRTLATYEIVITDDAGRRICTSRLTCALVARPPGGSDGAADPG